MFNTHDIESNYKVKSFHSKLIHFTISFKLSVLTKQDNESIIKSRHKAEKNVNFLKKVLTMNLEMAPEFSWVFRSYYLFSSIFFFMASLCNSS